MSTWRISLILYIAIALIILLLFHFKIHKTSTFSLLSISILCASFIILLVIFSKDAISSSKVGISLWFNVIFPSLFPFFVICNILSNTNASLIIGRFFEPIMRPLFNVPGSCAFALFMGILSGYPIGAICTLQLYKQDLITKTEAERLLTFTNNSGPIFVISAIGCGFFGSKFQGVLLYISHILSAIFVGIIFSFYKRNTSCPLKKQHLVNSCCKSSNTKNSSIITTFTDAITSSTSTIINIAGFIIFFSVLIRLLYKVGLFALLTKLLSPIITLLNIEPSLVSNFFSGLLEITSGASLICKLPGTTHITKLICTAFLLGFAGISIHFQVYSVISKSNISILPFVIGKFLQGFLNSIFLVILLCLV